MLGCEYDVFNACQFPALPPDCAAALSRTHEPLHPAGVFGHDHERGVDVFDGLQKLGNFVCFSGAVGAEVHWLYLRIDDAFRYGQRRAPIAV